MDIFGILGFGIAIFLVAVTAYCTMFLAKHAKEEERRNRA